jgi:hypothetical protein
MVNKRKRLKRISGTYNPDVPDANSEHDEKADDPVPIKYMQQWCTRRAGHDFRVLPCAKSRQKEKNKFEGGWDNENDRHE